VGWALSFIFHITCNVYDGQLIWTDTHTCVSMVKFCNEYANGCQGCVVVEGVFL
jgi:hypothetical protein